MRIVVLDGHTLNPGDLSWAELEALGPCGVFDRTPPELVVERAAGAGAVLTNKTVLSADALARLPELRYIGVLATGYNVVDVTAATARGITVTNVPDYGTRAVAQMTFALVLELAHRVGRHAESVRQGQWSRCPDFCYWEFPLVELAGLTLGVVGFGRIGRAVAELGRAFGMRLVAHTWPPADAPPANVEFVSLDDLFARADVVTLHCPLTPETRHVVNRDRLRLMKPGAFLINTARGPLVDEPALAEALAQRQLAGAGLDVLSVEPPPADHPLTRAPNCFVTPHIAWAARASRARLLDVAVANLRGFLEGRPQNLVR